MGHVERGLGPVAEPAVSASDRSDEVEPQGVLTRRRRGDRHADDA